MADDALTEIDKAAGSEVTFMSRAGALTLHRHSAIRNYNEAGQLIRDIPGVVYRFNNHILRVRPGRDVMVETKPNWLAEGEDPDKERDVVEALKAHRDFNSEFWVDGEEPNKPRPFEKDVLAALAKASAALDVDELRAMLDAERSSHNRPLLVGALSSAVESVSRAQAELLAQEQEPVSGDGENALEWSESDTVEDLQAVADRAGLDVKGTGADGNVLKGDLVKALRKETRARERKS